MLIQLYSIYLQFVMILVTHADYALLKYVCLIKKTHPQHIKTKQHE